MPTIIRATDRNGGTQAQAFNFDDMGARAEAHVARVRAEAKKIVDQARREAESIRKRAEQDGRQAAMDEVENMVREQLSSARNVIAEIQHAKQAWLTRWEASAVRVAAAIAQRLIRRELPNHPEIALTLVREALELAAGSAQLRILMHPDDHKALGKQVEILVEELSGLGEAEFVADPDITPGGCRVETRFGTIDQQFEAQLQRIAEELG